MFLKPLSKCSSCLPYVLLITFQPVTSLSVNYTTFLGNVIFIFGCHKLIFDGFSTFKMNFYAISFADILEGFTQSIVLYSNVAFAYGPIVLIVVFIVSWSTCLGFHSVDGNNISQSQSGYSICHNKLIHQLSHVAVPSATLGQNISPYMCGNSICHYGNNISQFIMWL